MCKLLSFVFFLFVVITGVAQSNYGDSVHIDSLKREMDRYTKKDTIKINKIIDYIYNLNQQDIEKGIPLLKDTLKISKDLSDLNWQPRILQELGEIAVIQNKFDESIPYFLEALKLSEAAGFKKQEAIMHGRLSGSDFSSEHKLKDK